MKKKTHKRRSWKRPTPSVVGSYVYRDEDREPLFRVVRGKKKNFWQERYDGGRWVRGSGCMDGVRWVPYRLPELLEAAASGKTIHIAEGEKDVEAIIKTGAAATCNLGGAGKWRDEYVEYLEGARRVVIWADKDDPGRRHAEQVATSLRPTVQEVLVVEAREGKDATDHLAAGYSLEEAFVREKAATLEQVVATFRKHLHMPDPAPLYATLATYASTKFPGDPVWLMIVAPPSSSKTEIVQSLRDLPDVHCVSTLTGVAALLSGSKEKGGHSKGGLLREIGSSGTVLLKDFGSILGLHHEKRAEILAALREIYDGRWDRRVGTEGGKLLNWEGRLCVIAAVTPVIDKHHAFTSSMGERFVLLRLLDVSADETARKALRRSTPEQEIRRELSVVVQGLLNNVDTSSVPNELPEEEEVHIRGLSLWLTRCRTPVVRDRYTRDIDFLPEPEAPPRVALMLLRLLHGLRVIGVSEPDVWRILGKIATDCMPRIRQHVLRVLGTAPLSRSWTSAEVSEASGCPRSSITRALEDLNLIGVVSRSKRKTRNRDCYMWRLKESMRHRFDLCRQMPSRKRAGHQPAVTLIRSSKKKMKKKVRKKASTRGRRGCGTGEE